MRITPFNGKIEANVTIPGSKSITNRVLLLAAIAEGESTLDGVLFAKDTEATLTVLEKLGIVMAIDREQNRVCINGCGGVLPKQSAELYTHEAGTLSRLLVPLCAAQPQANYQVNAAKIMCQRPMAPLLTLLEQYGVEITYVNQQNHLPFTLKSKGLPGGHWHLANEVSSQFYSALLQAAPLAQSPVMLTGVDIAEKPYCLMSLRLMEKFGICVSRSTAPEPLGHLSNGTLSNAVVPRLQPRDPAQQVMLCETGAPEKAVHNDLEQDALRQTVVICQPQTYQACDYYIEPDCSSASYFLALPALFGGHVFIPHYPLAGLQGDVRFLAVLAQMGCRVERFADGVSVHGPGKLKGITVNVRQFSDTFMTLAALAVFAEGPTRISGIAHTRAQESNRPHAMATNLQKMGIRVEETEDSLTIYPGIPQFAEVESYNDHRIAMSLTLVGLAGNGVLINQPNAVAKTFPHFYDLLNTTLNARHCYADTSK